MPFGLSELILLLTIVMLLFGVGRISKIAGELGSGMRAFQKGLKASGDQPVYKEE